jgi:excinuclease ABC subunit B
MARAIGETERRRNKQIAFNLENGITPRGVVKRIRDLIDGVYSDKSDKESMRMELEQARLQDMSEKDVAKEIKRMEKQMMEHARNLEFEQAAATRDQLGRLRALTFGATPQDRL